MSESAYETRPKRPNANSESQKRYQSPQPKPKHADLGSRGPRPVGPPGHASNGGHQPAPAGRLGRATPLEPVRDFGERVAGSTSTQVIHMPWNLADTDAIATFHVRGAGFELLSPAGGVPMLTSANMKGADAAAAEQASPTISFAPGHAGGYQGELTVEIRWNDGHVETQKVTLYGRARTLQQAPAASAPAQSHPEQQPSQQKRLDLKTPKARAIDRASPGEVAPALQPYRRSAQPQSRSKPAPEVATPATSSLPIGYDDGAIQVEPDRNSDRQKVAGFDQIANYTPRETATPSHVRLPKSIVGELDVMWAESQAGGKEQGGNVVRTYGGHYQLNRTHDPADDGDTYHPDTSNVGWLDRHAAVVHTHPLGPSEPDHVSFSDVDLAALVNEEQPLNILRSGQQTYMIARTREFDALIDKNNDPEKLLELQKAMRTVYDDAYHAEKREGGSHPSAVEKGVIAVCRTFHLIYYWGQGQDLHRVR